MAGSLSDDCGSSNASLDLGNRNASFRKVQHSAHCFIVAASHISKRDLEVTNTCASEWHISSYDTQTAIVQ